MTERQPSPNPPHRPRPTTTGVAGDPHRGLAVDLDPPGGQKVAAYVGPSPSYLEDLVSPAKTLGDSDLLDRAVADAEDAVVVLYAGAGNGAWLEFLSDGDIPKSGAEVLDAAGTSVTRDGSWTGCSPE